MQCSLKSRAIIGQSRPSFIEILRTLGTTSSLLFCLDAGDANSVEPGSELGSWKDTSGSNNHFALGDSRTTTAFQPQFLGTQGRRSEMEKFRGITTAVATGGVFEPATVSTYDDGWHQNNGIFSAVFVFSKFGSSSLILMNNANGFAAGMDNGAGVHISTGDALVLITDVGTGSADAQLTSLTYPNASFVGQPMFAGVSYTEAGPTAILRANGATSTTTTTASVNVTNPPDTLKLGGIGTKGTMLVEFQYLHMAACWSRALSSAELALIYRDMKQKRFPSMP